MSITKEFEWIGMRKASEAVAYTLREMIKFARPGITTKELDEFGAMILAGFGAKSAPKLAYKFPGHHCISINNEFCHGIPSHKKILKEGDLINIDVSAELNGFWADNGCSFVLGNDIYKHQELVNASKIILKKAIDNISDGVCISDIGYLMESEAKKMGYKVIKNLGGHGIGRKLHEQPDDLLNYKNPHDQRQFKKDSVVAIETFISTTSTYADTLNDGWTLVGNKGGYMAQHEHTIVITEHKPIILTEMNGIWN
jgi:methionine aminopeptidase, type I